MFTHLHAEWVVALVFLAAIVRLHTEHAAWCATGVVAVSYLCKGLKHVFKQKRPEGSKKKDPGMPSNHATGILYCSAYASMGVLDSSKEAWPSWPAACEVAALYGTGCLLVSWQALRG